MTDDLDRIIAGLSEAQRKELRRVFSGDQGALARGDPSGLAQTGLATPPLGTGFYRLTDQGAAVRQRLQEMNDG